MAPDAKTRTAHSMKTFLLWICLPLILGVVFVVAPCYLFGFFGWAGPWCGYNGAPPHMQPNLLQDWLPGSRSRFLAGAEGQLGEGDKRPVPSRR